MNKKGILVFCIALVIFITSCSSKNLTGKSVYEMPEITLAEMKSPWSGPVMIAHLKNFFGEEGLKVNVVSFSAGRLTLDAMLNGAAEISTASDIVITNAVTQNHKIYIIATFLETGKAVKIIARKDSGISIPKDLKNKKIGIFKGTTSDFFLDLYLKTEGMSIKDVKTVNIQPPDMAPALIRGDIDAYSCWEPNIFPAENELGEKAIIFANDKIYPLTFNILVNQDFAKKNPLILKKFLRAILKAKIFMEKNPQEAMELISDYTGMNKEALAKTWSDLIFTFKLDKEGLSKMLEEQAEWGKENGIISQKTEIPNYKDFIYTEIIENLNSD